MIHIYHGTGKGKTTAAIGLSVRAVGAGKKVVFSQFLKCKNSNEIKVLNDLCKILVCDKARGFYHTLSDIEKEQVKIEQQKLFCEVINTDADVIIMDEILDLCDLLLIDEKELISFLENNKDTKEIILTGRNPSDEIKNIADYITNMEKEKHPFDKGCSARYGIEF